MNDQPSSNGRRCPRCGDDLNHYRTRVFRCWRYRMTHDPHHWTGRASDVDFFCDGVARLAAGDD